jgi:preprotein translocase subunit SecD
VRFRDADTQPQARNLLPSTCPTWPGPSRAEGSDFKLSGVLKPERRRKVQETGRQAEHHHAAQPRQRTRRGRAGDPAAGPDRVVVQLPGVQDTAKAKDIIGRTATLEVRMVDDSAEAAPRLVGSGPVPFGSERYVERGGRR